MNGRWQMAAMADGSDGRKCRQRQTITGKQCTKADAEMACLNTVQLQDVTAVSGKEKQDRDVLARTEQATHKRRPGQIRHAEAEHFLICKSLSVTKLANKANQNAWRSGLVGTAVRRVGPSRRLLGGTDDLS